MVQQYKKLWIIFETLLASYFSPKSSVVKSVILKFRDSERLEFTLSICLNFTRISIVRIKILNAVVDIISCDLK
jgi:hypothetical protein